MAQSSQTKYLIQIPYVYGDLCSVMSGIQLNIQKYLFIQFPHDNVRGILEIT